MWTWRAPTLKLATTHFYSYLFEALINSSVKVVQLWVLISSPGELVEDLGDHVSSW